MALSTSRRRKHLAPALAVFVAAFVGLYPYLEVTGLCGAVGCPEARHAVGFSASCLVAVLIASGAVTSAFAHFFGRRTADRPRPVQTYLPPDTPPPQALLGT